MRDPDDYKSNPEAWEKGLLRDFVFELHREQVKDRRWRMALRILRSSALLIIALTFAISTFVSNSLFASKSEQALHTAYIDITGELAAGAQAAADRIIPAIQKAFNNPKSTAVVLRINSPGGSPVQAGRIYEEVKFQRHEHPEKKIYAVIDEMGASGGYYIAAAADEIYADQASLVGSIGVISSSFGFTELMAKLGIERRTFTAGENKVLMDPFLPLPKNTEELWESILANTHAQFISRVKEGRGEKLVNKPELFSGQVWNGEQALELGLIDGIGHLQTVARDVVGQPNMRDYTPSAGFLDSLTSGAMVSLHSLLYDAKLTLMY